MTEISVESLSWLATVPMTFILQLIKRNFVQPSRSIKTQENVIEASILTGKGESKTEFISLHSVVSSF